MLELAPHWIIQVLVEATGELVSDVITRNVSVTSGRLSASTEHSCAHHLIHNHLTR